MENIAIILTSFITGALFSFIVCFYIHRLIMKSVIRDYNEELGELEEAMRRAFYEHFKKDINVKSEIGVMLPSSFDGKDSDELTIEQMVHGPPEYSQWEERN